MKKCVREKTTPTQNWILQCSRRWRINFCFFLPILWASQSYSWHQHASVKFWWKESNSQSIYLSLFLDRPHTLNINDCLKIQWTYIQHASAINFALSETIFSAFSWKSIHFDFLMLFFCNTRFNWEIGNISFFSFFAVDSFIHSQPIMRALMNGKSADIIQCVYDLHRQQTLVDGTEKNEWMKAQSFIDVTNEWVPV